MDEVIQNWLINLGVPDDLSPMIAQMLLLCLILVCSWMLLLLIRMFVRRALSNWIENTATI